MSSVPSGPMTGASTRQAGVARDGLKLFRLASAVIWTVLILLVCWLPRNLVHKIENESSWFQVPDLDKAIHVGIFVVLAILWRRFDPSRRAIAGIILGGFALGALTELGQLLPIVRRTASLYDFATDCVGLLVGVAIAPFLEPLFRTIERRLIRVSSAPASAGVEQ